jgi:calcium binding protein 39
VFAKYNVLLTSENYVTRRQSLKLLGELLLDRSNFSVMMRYICNKDNLKRMMMLLRDQSSNIQFEAFHVFKVRACQHSITNTFTHTVTTRLSIMQY